MPVEPDVVGATPEDQDEEAVLVPDAPGTTSTVSIAYATEGRTRLVVRGGFVLLGLLLVAIAVYAAMMVDQDASNSSPTSPAPIGKSVAQERRHIFKEVVDPETYAALVYTPPNGQAPFPLLLYLHGAGERGDDVWRLLSEGATGTPPVALAQGKADPTLASSFVVVAPQTPNAWPARKVTKFLDFLLSGKAGVELDSTRLYVTGHSLGGYGALLAGATGRFAAVVPVAPAGSVLASVLTGVPVWAFHGLNDKVVPPEYSSVLIKELREAGAPESEARVTLYEEAPTPPGWPDSVGHASTIPAYATPELYEWLLARHE